MITFYSASNPKYANAAKTKIDIDIVFTQGQPSVEYTCGQDDPISSSLFLAIVGGTYGAIADYAAPAITKDQLTSYANNKQNSVLSTGITVNVAAEGDPAINVLCDGSSATRADLALLVQFGQQNPTATRPWVDNNGISTVLTGAQFVELATKVGTWILNTYTTLGTILDKINSSQFTTYSQINGVSWPTS